MIIRFMNMAFAIANNGDCDEMPHIACMLLSQISGYNFHSRFNYGRHEVSKPLQRRVHACMPLIQVYMGVSSKISCFDCWPFSGGGSVVVDSLLLPLFVFFLCVMSLFCYAVLSSFQVLQK